MVGEAVGMLLMTAAQSVTVEIKAKNASKGNLVRRFIDSENVRDRELKHKNFFDFFEPPPHLISSNPFPERLSCSRSNDPLLLINTQTRVAFYTDNP